MSTILRGSDNIDSANINIANSPYVMTALNATGTAPIYACRAWVNFNGTGTVAIRASGNVSSITDNGVGNYTINFITPMPDANYSVSGFTNYIGGWINGNNGVNMVTNRNIHVTTVSVLVDAVENSVQIFR